MKYIKRVKIMVEAIAVALILVLDNKKKVAKIVTGFQAIKTSNI